jgi:transposase
MVTAHVQQLRSLQASITGIEHLIAGRLDAHSGARPPGAGTINLAQLPAEVDPILDRATSAEQAADECGAAPVTRASGKATGVYFRWAASTRVRKAIIAFADNARMPSPWAVKLSADVRARGKCNPQATCIVTRAWIRVIWACWHTGTRYNPATLRPAPAEDST